MGDISPILSYHYGGGNRRFRRMAEDIFLYIILGRGRLKRAAQVVFVANGTGLYCNISDFGWMYYKRGWLRIILDAIIQGLTIFVCFFSLLDDRPE